MRRRQLLAALLAWPAAARAAAGDYRFEPVDPTVQRGLGVSLGVRVWARAANVLVPGVEFPDASVDRSPDGQFGGRLPAFFRPSLDYGVYHFTADLPVDGTWALKFTAKAPGAEPVPGSVTFKVVGRLDDPNTRVGRR